MDKFDFLEELGSRLVGLPKEDRDRFIEYYSEMIDDRVEEGMTEQEAVADIGTPANVAKEILSTIPLTKIVKEKVKPKRRLSVAEIILIVLGAPVWVPVLVSLLSIIFSIYVVLWSVVLTFIGVNITFFAVAIALLAAFAGMLITAHVPEAFVCLGGCLVMTGLALLTMLFVKVLIKGVIWIGKQIVLGIKYFFVGKGNKK